MGSVTALGYQGHRLYLWRRRPDHRRSLPLATRQLTTHPGTAAGIIVGDDHQAGVAWIHFLKIDIGLAFTLNAYGWLARLFCTPAGFLRRDPLHSELFLIQFNHPLCSIWLLILSTIDQKGVEQFHQVILET